MKLTSFAGPYLIPPDGHLSDTENLKFGLFSEIFWIPGISVKLATIGIDMHLSITKNLKAWLK